MGHSNPRTITLVVAAATLASNILSSLLYHQLPNDPYHLASKFGWYLHFANIISVFGFIGAIRQHALSIALFSNYLIIDTILCAIPRFIIPILLNQLSISLCSTPSPLTTSLSVFSSTQQTYATNPSSPFEAIPLPPSPEPNYLELQAGRWTPAGCYKIVYLAQLTLIAGVLAATILQFAGALSVRAYARNLAMREIVEEERVWKSVERRSLCEERGLPVIEEGVEFDEEKV